jgi:predicted negative regulator of RcsB-dependent stress response
MKRTVIACSLAACMLSSCSAPSAAPEDGASEWLAAVRAAHERADDALGQGEGDRARAALTRALEQPLPAEVQPEDARVVHQDLWFRLGQIELDHSEPAQSLLRCDRGLTLGRKDDLFTANLLVARGRALAALGRDIEAAGSYQEALQINAKLLRAALGEPGGNAP